MEDKKALRKRIQHLKKQLSKEQCQIESEQVFSQLEKLDVFKKARHILCYWSLPDELPTQAFTNRWYKDKDIYLPKVEGNELSLHKYKGQEFMQKGVFGILEPVTPEFCDLKLLDLIIVPGVAYTSSGKRMGRGGGYYDRFLPKVPDAIKVGVAYQCQIVDDIPTEEHDINMDIVLNACKKSRKL